MRLDGLEATRHWCRCIISICTLYGSCLTKKGMNKSCINMHSYLVNQFCTDSRTSCPDTRAHEGSACGMRKPKNTHASLWHPLVHPLLPTDVKVFVCSCARLDANIHGCQYGCMHACVGTHTHAHGWEDAHMHEVKQGCKHACMCVRMHAWRNAWMRAWMHNCMDSSTYALPHTRIHVMYKPRRDVHSCTHR